MFWIIEVIEGLERGRDSKHEEPEKIYHESQKYKHPKLTDAEIDATVQPRYLLVACIL